MEEVNDFLQGQGENILTHWPNLRNRVDDDGVDTRLSSWIWLKNDARDWSREKIASELVARGWDCESVAPAEPTPELIPVHAQLRQYSEDMVD